MCALKKRLAECKRSHTQEWKQKLERLEDAVLEAQNTVDPKVIATAESDLQDYRREYLDMGKVCENYQVHYERLLFVLAAAVTHECFHVLTGFWSGFIKIFTPPKFFGAYPGKDGEAGEWWEYKHGFNGSVNLAWNRSGKNLDDPYPLDDENMSAGIPFIKKTRYRDGGSSDGEEWTRISHTFIRDYIKKGKYERSIPVLKFWY